MAAGMERPSLDLSQTVKNIVVCGNVWNSFSRVGLRCKLYYCII